MNLKPGLENYVDSKTFDLLNGKEETLNVPPLASREQLIAEIDRLLRRLEFDPEWPSYDGIYCRDRTIDNLQEIVDQQRRQIEELKTVVRGGDVA